MARIRKVGPPRRPAAHLYTIPELDDLQHQVTLRGCTLIQRMEQLKLKGIGHPKGPTQVLYWRDPQGRDWVAHAQ